MATGTLVDLGQCPFLAEGRRLARYNKRLLLGMRTY